MNTCNNCGEQEDAHLANGLCKKQPKDGPPKFLLLHDPTIGRPTQLKKTDPQIIGVDFDGTLCEHQWPLIGPMMKNADIVMRRLYFAGHKLIIWTARSGEEAILQARQWLYDKGIPFHSFNQELPEHLALYGPNPSRKIHCDILVDDHQLGGIPADWEAIYDLMVKHHGIKDTRGDDV